MHKIFNRSFHTSIAKRGYYQTCAYGYGIPLPANTIAKLNNSVTHVKNVNNFINLDEYKTPFVLHHERNKDGSVLFAANSYVTTTGYTFNNDIYGALSKSKLEDYEFYVNSCEQLLKKQLEDVLNNNKINVEEIYNKQNIKCNLSKDIFEHLFENGFNNWYLKNVKQKPFNSYFGYYIQGIV
jgi:hypothetical protein